MQAWILLGALLLCSLKISRVGMVVISPLSQPVAAGGGLLRPLPGVRPSVPGAAHRAHPAQHGAEGPQGAEDL